jgi:hypothetical protein
MNSESAHGWTTGGTDQTLVTALREALATEDTSSSELRDAVFAFVSGMKVRAEAPQQVVIALKAHVQTAGAPASAVEAEITERVVRWGIDAYYR